MEKTLTGPMTAPVAATMERPRDRSIDNLKVALVAGVIVGHTTIAWTGIGEWVFEEPHLGEPWFSIISMFLIAAMFGMALFFFIAGMYTAPSLDRKGTRRFLIDRVFRLGIPMLVFIVAMSPVIEYADPDNAGSTGGFWAFTVDIWWPPAPGPTWFLGVLLIFSLVYALTRKLAPRRGSAPRSLGVWHLVVAALLVTAVTFSIRLAVPLGVEVWRLSVGQAPGWIAGFTLGVLAAERRWLAPITPRIAKVTRRAAWAGVVAGVLALVGIALLGLDPERLFGGATWESLLFSAIEAVLVVSMPFWLVDLFRRRFTDQGRIRKEMSRAAFAAFLFHQLVLVGLVLASRFVPWPPEAEYLLVSVLGVAASYALGSLVVRLPGASRVI